MGIELSGSSEEGKRKQRETMASNKRRNRRIKKAFAALEKEGKAILEWYKDCGQIGS